MLSWINTDSIYLAITINLNGNQTLTLTIEATTVEGISLVLLLLLVYSLQSWRSLSRLSCSGWPCSSTLQNNELRPKMFCCFWSNTLEFTPIVCSWSITDTDSVLCAFEDCVILQSIWNTSIAPTWRFRLYRLLREHKFTYLLIYLLTYLLS